MFFIFILHLFRHAVSNLPRRVVVKLCHVIGIWVRFTKIVALYPKNMGPKHAKFEAIYITSDFDREYLRNESIQYILNRKDT